MKTDKYLKKHIPSTRYRREKISLEFSKSGVKQEWALFFNTSRLLTDKVYTSYNEPIYLRSTENCKTLEDVLMFLYNYSFSETFVRVISQLNLLENHLGGLYRLNEILKFSLDVKKLSGSVYFGRYEINFDNGYVSFLFSKIINDGTYKITGKRDLLKITNQILNRLRSNIEFLQAVKRLEIN